jgi:hypothetical protein
MEDIMDLNKIEILKAKVDWWKTWGAVSIACAFASGVGNVSATTLNFAVSLTVITALMSASTFICGGWYISRHKLLIAELRKK